jgi:hypothetical protein
VDVGPYQIRNSHKVGTNDSFSLLIVKKRPISVRKFLKFYLLGKDFVRMNNLSAFDCLFSVVCVSSLSVDVSNVRCAVDNELSRSWNEVVLTYFKVLCGHFALGAEGNHIHLSIVEINQQMY